MTLSIVILNCNQCGHTLRLLDSLFPYLEANSDTDAVIVDNGSSDGSPELITGWCERHPSVEQQIKLIPLTHNHGVAPARNIGINASSGQFILILDNDTIINATALDGLRQHLTDNPRCGICAPALLSPQGELQASAKPYPSLRLKIAHVIRPGQELARERAEMSSPHPWYVIGACQMLRRSTYESVGPLDENIFYGPEDADYCARVRHAGFTIDYLPHLNIIHDWRRATRRSPLSRLGLIHARALLHFWWKHPTSRS